MRWKKHSAEEIVGKLDQVRASTGAGTALSQAIKAVGVSEATYFRWRAQYGSLDSSQVSEMKRLEIENSRLRRAFRELELDQAFGA